MVHYRCHLANVPILLTAPHGGWNVNDASMTTRPKLPGVVFKGDLYTLDLLLAIDNQIRIRSRAIPHVVAAKFHRRYIDANRNSKISSQVAYAPGCDIGKLNYDCYHECIDECISHVLDGNAHGRALLLDIHGMRPYHDFILVGTRNGQTCSNQVNQAHSGFLWHLRSLLGNVVLPGN